MARVARMLWVAIAVLTLAGETSAQPLGATCSPPCRDGFSCVNGACEAICNPSCPAGTMCVDGRRCEPVAAQCNPPCPSGTVCVDGRRCEPTAAPAPCVPECREGYVCSQGECLVAPGAGPGAPATGVTITPGTAPVEPAPASGPAEPVTPQPPSDGQPEAEGEAAAAAAAAEGEPDEADDETTDPDPRTLLFKMRFGMGGTLSWEDSNDSSLSDESGLVGSIGFAVEKDWILASPLVDISLGLQLSGLWWNTQTASDLDVGRSTMIELDVVPKFSYTILPRFHAYFALPVGLTASFMKDDVAPNAFTDVGVGWGWNLSVWGGVQYDLSLFAVFLELGADIHNFSHTVTNLNGGTEQDMRFHFAQFALNLGLAFQ